MTMSFYGETLEVLTSHTDCLWPAQRVCHELDPRSFGKVYGHWNEKKLKFVSAMLCTYGEIWKFLFFSIFFHINKVINHCKTTTRFCTL